MFNGLLLRAEKETLTNQQVLHSLRPSDVQIMAGRLVGAKPLSETMLFIVNWTLTNKLQRNYNRNSYISFTEMPLKLSSGKWRPFCLVLNVLTSNSWFDTYPWIFQCFVDSIFHLHYCVNTLRVLVNLTLWCRVTHIYVHKLSIIGSAMASRLAGFKPLSEWNIVNWTHRKCIWKCLESGGHFVSASMCLGTHRAE